MNRPYFDSMPMISVLTVVVTWVSSFVSVAVPTFGHVFGLTSVSVSFTETTGSSPSAAGVVTVVVVLTFSANSLENQSVFTKFFSASFWFRYIVAASTFERRCEVFDDELPEYLTVLVPLVDFGLLNTLTLIISA